MPTRTRSTRRVLASPLLQREIMRTALLIAVAFTIGCDPGTQSSLLGSDLRRREGAPASAEEGEDSHDETDVQGVGSKDPGNANADTPPEAPTVAPTAASEFEVALDTQTPSLGLGETVAVTATVTPKNGFTGPVQLAVTGLPAGATATPVTADVVAGPVSGKLMIKAELTANVTAVGVSVPLVVKATTATAEATAPANFKIAPKVTVTIPMNVDALRGARMLRAEYGGDAFAGLGTFKTQAGNGIVVSVFNADSKGHIIHGPGGEFPHGDTANPIAPNSFEPRTRTLTAGRTATAYLHEGTQGEGASFQIRIENAN